MKEQYAVTYNVNAEVVDDKEAMEEMRKSADAAAKGMTFVKMVSGTYKDDFVKNRVTIHFIYQYEVLK